MEPLSIAECRKFLQTGGKSLPDEDVLRLRDMLYVLGDVIADAYTHLEDSDQSTFNPPGDAVDFFQSRIAEMVKRMTKEEASQ